MKKIEDINVDDVLVYLKEFSHRDISLSKGKTISYSDLITLLSHLKIDTHRTLYKGEFYSLNCKNCGYVDMEEWEITACLCCGSKNIIKIKDTLQYYGDDTGIPLRQSSLERLRLLNNINNKKIWAKYHSK